MTRRSSGRSARGVPPARPSPREAYSAGDIVDAPEHHEYARAMGLLTWATWDEGRKPFEERLKDFLQAYPSDAPTRFQGPMLAKAPEGEYGPAPDGGRLARVLTDDNSFGALTEVFARHGLKLRSGSDYVPRRVE